MTADQPLLISWWDHSPGQTGASAEMADNLRGWSQGMGSRAETSQARVSWWPGQRSPFPLEWPMFHDHVGLTQELIFNKALSII